MRPADLRSAVLPDDVLEEVYFQNALKVIPGIDAAVFPR